MPTNGELTQAWVEQGEPRVLEYNGVMYIRLGENNYVELAKRFDTTSYGSETYFQNYYPPDFTQIDRFTEEVTDIDDLYFL